jgi:uncharacterized membrane protein
MHNMQGEIFIGAAMLLMAGAVLLVRHVVALARRKGRDVPTFGVGLVMAWAVLWLLERRLVRALGLHHDAQWLAIGACAVVCALGYVGVVLYLSRRPDAATVHRIDDIGS